MSAATPSTVADRDTDPADRAAEVSAALAEVSRAIAEGASVAGYLHYEAGAALVPGLHHRSATAPLLWFGVFDSAESIDVAAALPDPAGAWIGEVEPAIDAERYAAECNTVLDLIAAGDLYQANLTFGATVPVAGHPLAVYAAIRPRAAAGHGAVVSTRRRASRTSSRKSSVRPVRSAQNWRSGASPLAACCTADTSFMNS